jgi:hypothetical protein
MFDPYRLRWWITIGTFLALSLLFAILVFRAKEEGRRKYLVIISTVFEMHSLVVFLAMFLLRCFFSALASMDFLEFWTFFFGLL